MAIQEKKLEGQFVIPEGKEIESCKCLCSKHGDVSNSSFFFSYNIKNKDDSIQRNNFIFCSACISELLLKFQKEGQLGEISLVPVLRDKQPESDNEITEEKLVEEELAEENKHKIMAHSEQ